MAMIDVDQVLAQLSLTEKVELLAGCDFWHTTPLPKHGIISVRMTDGPHHVRGARFFNGTPTAAVPCSPALGATFDMGLVRDLGRLLGDECVAKGCHVLLGPSMNMIRSPLAGRGYECFSEDPILSGYLGAAYCQGLQENGVMAAVKHYVCHDQEQDNLANSVIVSEKALREIYLPPFKIAIGLGRPAAVMMAQHRVNHVHASESRHLLNILKKEWKFPGLVMSDWFGVYSTTDSVEAGVDLEMPGPARFRGEALAHAIVCNRTPIAALDERARAVLEFSRRAAASGIPEHAVERELDRPEDRALLRRAAADSFVLLKNEDNVLPLDPTKPIAVIGPNAEGAAYRGGKTAHMVPYHVVSPLEGIETAVASALGSSEVARVEYVRGVNNHRELPVLGAQLTNARGARGFDMRVYEDAPRGDGAAPDARRDCLLHRELVNASGFFMNYENPNKVLRPFWYVDLEGTFTPPESGIYEFSVTVQGTANLYINGDLLVDNTSNQRQGTSFFGSGTVEETSSIALDAGRAYSVLCRWCTKPKLVNSATVSFGPGGIRLGCAKKLGPHEDIAAATELARQHEQVVVFAGITGEWETEGSDRATMDMLPEVDELVRAVLQVNSNAVICLHSAMPLAMPWLQEAKAVGQAWYGGSQQGHGVADVLFGSVNPSAKLPLTIPQRLQDNPAYINYRSEAKRILYGEDIYVGYRYYDKVDQDVSFCFGHGLSYTTFELSELDVHVTGPKVVVSIAVTNTGQRDGAEVVQVYFSKPVTAHGRPPKELKWFEKPFLVVGETKNLEMEIDTKSSTACWDESRSSWVCEKGQYTVRVGTSSRGDFLSGTFEIQSSWWWTEGD